MNFSGTRPIDFRASALVADSRRGVVRARSAFLLLPLRLLRRPAH
jgi:hypothetical protein